VAYVKGSPVTTVEKAITAQNQFTDWVRLPAKNRVNAFTASLVDDSTTLNVIWVVQARRIKSDGSAGNIIDVYTSPAAAANGGLQTAQYAGTWEFRVGVKTGGYTAGTGVAALSW
jgi:hypothetical protein